MRFFRWVKRVIAGLKESNDFFNECERKRIEWYRQEIQKAIDERDFVKAQLLEREMYRPYDSTPRPFEPPFYGA